MADASKCVATQRHGFVVVRSPKEGFDAIFFRPGGHRTIRVDHVTKRRKDSGPDLV